MNKIDAMTEPKGGTPRCDDAEFFIQENAHHSGPVVSAEFARALERALSALQAERGEPLIATGHPESNCEACGRENAVWFAPSELWNKAVRAVNAPEILCPVCFIKLARDAGIDPSAWMLAPETHRLVARRFENVSEMVAYMEALPTPSSLPVEARHPDDTFGKGFRYALEIARNVAAPFPSPTGDEIIRALETVGMTSGPLRAAPLSPEKGKGVRGKLAIMGEIETTHDGKFPMALLITFSDAASVRQAISDGQCCYTFGDLSLEAKEG